MVIARINYSPDQSISSDLHPLYRSMFSLYTLATCIAIAWNETLSNQQAMLWCVCSLLMAWSLLPQLRNTVAKT
jgi:hypothetical protein